jgi:outer membrane lipoprotein-sorting protein
MKLICLMLSLLFLSGCTQCYQTREDAWDACNDKYNGKCSYLGKKYQVCKSSQQYNSDYRSEDDHEIN